MISNDGVASAAEKRRERVAGSEKKPSQEGESRGKLRRTSDSDSAVVDEPLRSLDRRKLWKMQPTRFGDQWR